MIYSEKLLATKVGSPIDGWRKLPENDGPPQYTK